MTLFYDVKSCSWLRRYQRLWGTS